MFDELTVIDCSTVLAGPSVGTFFAELGARVLKIENPRNPDVTRSWKLPSEDKKVTISAYFSSINYKKSYQQLDFKDSTDLEKLKELIKQADVFISNFKKGDDIKFQLTDSDLFALNPTLIIGKISGFGEDSDRVAYDLILQAETGFMSMNGTPESGPVKMPVALIDVLCAHQLKEGLLLALLNRTKNKKGQVVTVSLYDTAVASLANQASNYLMEKHIPARIGSLHPNIAPYGEIFETKDKKLITFAIGSNKHFDLFCRFLHLEKLLTDERFKENISRVENRIELFKILQEVLSTFDSQTLCTHFNHVFVPCGIVKNLQEVFENPQSQCLIREEKIDGSHTKRVSQIAFQIRSC